MESTSSLYSLAKIAETLPEPEDFEESDIATASIEMASLQTLGIEGDPQELLINARASRLAEEKQALTAKFDEVSRSLHAATYQTFNAWHYQNHAQKQARSLAEWGHDPSNFDAARLVIDHLVAETSNRSQSEFGKAFDPKPVLDQVSKLKQAYDLFLESVDAPDLVAKLDSCIAVLADKEPDWNLIRGWENPRKKWKNDPNNWPTEVNGAKPYTYLRGE